MAQMPTPEEHRSAIQNNYKSVTELMNAFEQNYLLDLAQGSAEVGEEAKIV